MSQNPPPTLTCSERKINVSKVIKQLIEWQRRPESWPCTLPGTALRSHGWAPWGYGPTIQSKGSEACFVDLERGMASPGPLSLLPLEAPWPSATCHPLANSLASPWRPPPFSSEQKLLIHAADCRSPGHMPTQELVWRLGGKTLLLSWEGRVHN